jgi:beta-keto acid cleavage enzyme
MHIFRRVLPGTTDDDVLARLIPFQDGTGNEPELAADFGGDGNLALGGKLGTGNSHAIHYHGNAFDANTLDSHPTLMPIRHPIKPQVNEDSLWIGPGQLAETNAQQVRAARQVIEGLGLQVATPDEARSLLQLKGGNNVNF